MGEDRPFWIWFAVLCAAFAIAAYMLAFVVTAAHAQQMPCKPADEMKALLADRYQEREIAAGIMGPQQIFVLFASDGGKTWTMLAISTNGIACAVASGADWTPADRGV